MTETTLIEIAYATPERQKIVECEIVRGCSVRDAVKMSAIKQFFPEVDLDTAILAFLAKPCQPAMNYSTVTVSKFIDR